MEIFEILHYTKYFTAFYLSFFLLPLFFHVKYFSAFLTPHMHTYYDISMLYIKFYILSSELPFFSSFTMTRRHGNTWHWQSQACLLWNVFHFLRTSTTRCVTLMPNTAASRCVGATGKINADAIVRSKLVNGTLLTRP